jgi:hypothetical protein
MRCAVDFVLAGDLVRQFRVCQKLSLADNPEAAAGLACALVLIYLCCGIDRFLAGNLVRQFRVRQKFSLADNLEAAAGLAYALVLIHLCCGIDCFLAGNLVRQFRVRQKFSLADNLEAAAGLAYDFKADAVSPTAALIYRLDPDNKKSRIELSSTDKKLLLRKGWQVGFEACGLGLLVFESVQVFL